MSPRHVQAASRPQLICVFGAPGVGVSTMLTLLTNSVMTPMIVRDARASIEEAAEVIGAGKMLFGDDWPLDGDHISDLVDAGLLNSATGAVVRLWTDEEMCNDRRVRAGKAPLTIDEWRRFYKRVENVEETCRAHALRYSMVTNGDPLFCAQELIRIAGIQD